jgi:hypothetical protein
MSKQVAGHKGFMPRVQVLREELGMANETIENLRSSGVI